VHAHQVAPGGLAAAIAAEPPGGADGVGLRLGALLRDVVDLLGGGSTSGSLWTPATAPAARAAGSAGIGALAAWLGGIC
jgi:hypothetical protein